MSRWWRALAPLSCVHSRLCLVHVQAGNTHVWHDASEQQKQQQQQQQKAKQRQQQQKLAKKRQQRENGGETRESTLLPKRGHSPTLTSHGHRFDSELNQLEAEAASRKERAEQKRRRKRQRDQSGHNKRTNKRKNLRRSDDRKARARTRSQMAHVFSELLHPARSREVVEVTAVQMVAATETERAVAAAMGCNGGEEAGNALASGETVQARCRLPWPQEEPLIRRPMYQPHCYTCTGTTHALPLSLRCKWSSRRARRS